MVDRAKEALTAILHILTPPPSAKEEEGAEEGASGTEGAGSVRSAGSQGEAGPAKKRKKRKNKRPRKVRRVASGGSLGLAAAVTGAALLLQAVSYTHLTLPTKA